MNTNTPILGYLFDGKFVKEIIPEQERSAIIVYDPDYVESLLEAERNMNKFRF